MMFTWACADLTFLYKRPDFSVIVNIFDETLWRHASFAYVCQTKDV